MKELTKKDKRRFLKFKKKIEAKRAKIAKLYRDIEKLQEKRRR